MGSYRTTNCLSTSLLDSLEVKEADLRPLNTYSKPEVERVICDYTSGLETSSEDILGAHRWVEMFGL